VDTTLNELRAAANEVKHLTADQLTDLMRMAMTVSRRDHALLLTCYLHALRASEVAQIRVGDLDMASFELTVRRAKGSLRTTQPLFSHKGHPEMDEVKALRRWLTQRTRSNEPTDVLFASQKGGALCPDSVNRLFKRYVRLTNDDRVVSGKQPIPPSASHVHALKHTRCSLLIDAGVDFFKVGLIAGHAAVSSTLRYVHGSQTLACRAAQASDYEIHSQRAAGIRLGQ
jgi:integrase/recombinase XerD